MYPNMNRITIIALTGALTFGLLTACGNANESAHTNGHGGMDHDTASTASVSGGHDGHGGHAASESASRYRAAFSFAAGAAKANEPSDLQIQITDAAGQAVNEFERNHEKLMHLIVVSKDFSYFRHLHPDYQGQGKFAIGTSFPSGGEYKVFADFVPTGGENATLGEWVNVAGEAKAAEPIEADAILAKTVDGKDIELAMSSAKSNEEVTLTFTITDARTKEGIRNLEPYLGAVGHVVILSEDAEHYLHVHPMDERATGPKATFMTSFPKSGTYKIWGQFQQDGEVFTVPFVVNVN